MAGTARRRQKEVSDVDEGKEQFGSIGGGRRRSGGVVAGLGGRGPAVGSKSAKQQQFGQSVDTKPLGTVDLPIDAEPFDSVCSPADATTEPALAGQPQYHVQTLDEPKPVDQSAHRSALSAQDAGQSQQLTGLTEPRLLAEPDSRAESVAEHQSIDAESVCTENGDAFDAEPVVVDAESAYTKNGDAADTEPVVVDAVAKDSDGAAAAVVQPTEPAKSAAYAFDDAGGSYPESVDPVECPAPHDIPAAGSFHADTVSIAERACNAAVRQHGRYAEA